MNPLALLVAPLAGIALLSAAAAVALNPVLVQINVTGKRKKRSAEQDEATKILLESGDEKLREMKVNEALF